MMEKEYFYDDIDHIYNTVVCQTLKREGKSPFAISTIVKAPTSFVDWYLSQDFRRASAIISDYLCSRLYDYRYEEMDKFFREHHIDRDVTYFKELINFIKDEFNRRNVAFSGKDKNIIAILAASPTAITHTKAIIEKASIYCNLTITKEDIVALSNRELYLIEPKKEEEKKEDSEEERHTTVNSEKIAETFERFREKYYSNIFIKEVKEDVWEVEGGEIFLELFKEKNAKPVFKPAATTNCSFSRFLSKE